MGALQSVVTYKNVENMIFFQKRGLTARQLVENIGLSYQVVYNKITSELDLKKLFARLIPRILTDACKYLQYPV